MVLLSTIHHSPVPPPPRPPRPRARPRRRPRRLFRVEQSPLHSSSVVACIPGPGLLVELPYSELYFQFRARVKFIQLRFSSIKFRRVRLPVISGVYESELTTLEELLKLSVPRLRLIGPTARPPATPLALGGRRARGPVCGPLPSMQAAAGPVLKPDTHWQALDIPLRAPVARVDGPSRACSDSGGS